MNWLHGAQRTKSGTMVQVHTTFKRLQKPSRRLMPCYLGQKYIDKKHL